MLNSDLARIIRCVAGLTVSACAADLTLENEGKLTGNLISMDVAGMLTLDSPLADSPIKVDGERVESVTFNAPSKAPPVPDQRLHLVNGDILPVNILSFSGDAFQVSSETLGEISVAREAVSFIQFGIHPEKVIYRAGDDITGWKMDTGGEKGWEIVEGKFIATGQGTVYRDFKLPEKFLIRFTLEWSKQPAFTMFFADPLDQKGKRVNRYSFQFAGGGLAVQRESKGKQRYIPMVTLSKTNERFPSNSMQVELRVDRTRGLIELHVNGEPEGRYTDPVPDIPGGGGIVLASQNTRGGDQVVSDFQVLAWDDRGDRHRSEDRGDREKDSLIGRFGERFGGTLSSIQPSEEGALLEFKSDFQKDPVLLPQQEVSTIFLAGKKAGSDPKDFEGPILRLPGGGEMRVSSVEFGEKAVRAVHPLLGEVEIARSGITALERRSIPKAKPVKSR